MKSLHHTRGRQRCLPLIFLLLALIACNFPGLATTEAPQGVGTLALTQVATILNTPGSITASPTTLPPSLTPVPTIPYTPTFETASCKFAPPSGYLLECGYLNVPENRTNSNTQMIRLHVAIFRTRSPNPAPDPVIHLSGGPGSHGSSIIAYHFQQGEGRFLEDRDYIFFDQRGTGNSEPSLACPEREDISARLLSEDLTIEQQNQLEIDAYMACRDRLIGQGIDLTAYNSAASAADVNDLRIALGYEQINLYGVSYGTRLALTVMRDYPAIVRSAILDSTYPPEQDLYIDWSPNAQRAYDALFAACAGDPECNAEFPDLETTFYEVVDALNASPARVLVVDPSTGREVNVLLTGDLLIDVVFGALYRPDVMVRLPRMIFDVRRGYYNPFLQGRLTRYFDRTTSRGMQLSVQCSEEIPFSTNQELSDAAAGVRPEITHNYQNELGMLYDLCPLWVSVAANPIEKQPVHSSIPTLIYGGHFDPITPPEWGQITSQNLTQAYYLEFAAAGHWAMRVDRCPIEIAAAFLNNPTTVPDTSCIAAIPLLDFVP
jgi:pimeloyl-ACP methyl ester carboxylesterase